VHGQNKDMEEYLGRRCDTRERASVEGVCETTSIVLYQPMTNQQRFRIVKSEIPRSKVGHFTLDNAENNATATN
jgi:hypothetical protein